jgi:hypothetical protein
MEMLYIALGIISYLIFCISGKLTQILKCLKEQK